MGRGEILVVGMLEQPFVQSFGVTGQVVRKHMERTSQRQRHLTEVNVKDCLADVGSGDIEDTCFLTPDPGRVVTVVTPPVNDAFLNGLVVTYLWMCHSTMDTSPAVRLSRIRFEHEGRIRLGVTHPPATTHVVIRRYVVIEALSAVWVETEGITGLLQEVFPCGDFGPVSGEDRW